MIVGSYSYSIVFPLSLDHSHFFKWGWRGRWWIILDYLLPKRMAIEAAKFYGKCLDVWALQHPNAGDRLLKSLEIYGQRPVVFAWRLWLSVAATSSIFISTAGSLVSEWWKLKESLDCINNIIMPPGPSMQSCRHTPKLQSLAVRKISDNNDQPRDIGVTNCQTNPYEYHG